MVRRFIQISLNLCVMLLMIVIPAPLIAHPGRHAAVDPPTSTGRAPGSAASARGAIQAPSAPSTLNAAFAVELYPGENLHYLPNTAAPGEWLTVGDTSGTAYYAGDFVGGDVSRLYVIDFNANELHTLNTATGADTTVGACLPRSGQVWTGATGTDDGVLYASATDNLNAYLYTINTATGAATEIGQITNALAVIDIAINAEGTMIGLDIENDQLVRINPATGAGTVIGSIGFDANYAQGMDFEATSGTLYLAAYNDTLARGELRTANTTTGSTALVGVFPDKAEVGVLAFTPPPSDYLRNPGFEDGWTPWRTAGSPYLSGQSHSGAWSVNLSGETCWVWQEVVIPGDALDVTFGYWLTGASSDPDWDNDILIGGIWDPTRQIKVVDVRHGLTYFLYSPAGEWKRKLYRLTPAEVAVIAGQRVVVGFQLTQDWLPGYHKTSTAYVDDALLYVTRPTYDYAVYLPLVVR